MAGAYFRLGEQNWLTKNPEPFGSGILLFLLVLLSAPDYCYCRANPCLFPVQLQRQNPGKVRLEVL